jgi:cation:H+ antiporter
VIVLYCTGLLLAFVLLFKCADYFITGSVGIAGVLHIPKLIMGIVLVGLATTAPEFAVSVQAAFLGHSEIALGNAIGSVICDDGVALALAVLLSPVIIYVDCRVVRVVGSFLLLIDCLAFLLAANGTVGRLEGLILLGLLIAYFWLMYTMRDFFRKGTFLETDQEELGDKQKQHLEKVSRWSLIKRPGAFFAIGITGVVLTSRIVIWSAVNIAEYFSISETIIGMTVIAFGTSLPEISTCVTAALKKEGEIAVGNILGADVLNILWIIGMSALVRPIVVEKDVINFSFPFMILIVTVMLAAMTHRCRLGKTKGFILLALYGVYLFLTITFFI